MFSDQSPLYQKGWQRLQEVDDIAGEQVIAALKDIAPNLADYIISFGFGEIYCRHHLSVKQRELATIAALTALGNAQPQLKVHLHAALNVGLSQAEIIETLTQMAIYTGFPAALNAIFCAKEVFANYQPAKIPRAPLAVVSAFLASLKQGRVADELLAEHVTWHIPGNPQKTPWVGTFQGKAQVTQIFKTIGEIATPLAFNISRMMDAENEVLVRGDFSYHFKASEKNYTGNFVMQFDINNGLIERHEIFEDSLAISNAYQS